MSNQYDESYAAYIRSIKSYGRISVEREKELSIIIQTSEDKEQVAAARNELIMANLFLVVKWANQYAAKNYGSSTMDLIAAGNLGLMDSADKYDSEAGFNASFGTYASAAIKRKIAREIRLDTLIHYPVDHIYYWIQLCDLETEYGEDLTDEIILEKMKITPGLLKRLKKSYKQKPLYLEDLNRHGDSGSTQPWEDFIENEAATANAKTNDLKTFLEHHIDLLDPNRRTVIQSLYLTPGVRTLGDAAKAVGLSSERVRQLAASGIKKIRDSITKDVASGKEFSVDLRLIQELRREQRSQDKEAIQKRQEMVELYYQKLHGAS